MVNDIKTLQMYVLELSAKVKALKEEIDILSSGGFMPAGSVYFADLPSLINERYGFVYNIKDDFTTTSDFIEGAGKRYSAGTNVGIVKDDNNNLKYDTLASFVDTAAIYEAIGAKQSINLSEEIAGASTVEGALKAINQSAGITVDAEISSVSTNPVQNKVIKGQLDLKLDTDGKANSATSADYATKAERDSHNNVISSTYATKTELSDGLSGKVNAVAGKGLSSNDYTNEDKDYVDGLPAQLLGKQDKYETITYVQWQAMTPEQQAAKDYYISDYPSSVLTAGNIAYDNTSSGMAANKVQGAIDELKSGLTNQTARSRSNITSRLTNLVTAVAEQNLEKYGYKIGDYFTGASGYTYHLADMDTFYGGYNNNAIVNTHHISLVVKTGANSKWAETNDTSGGYKTSTLHSFLSSTVLDNIKSDMIALFGGSTGLEHLVSHKLLWTTATSAWAWSDNAEYISALSEPQVYGTNVWAIDGYQTGEAWKWLEIFHKFNYCEILGNIWWWLRSISSASVACFANLGGDAGGNDASRSSGAVGLIIFH